MPTSRKLKLPHIIKVRYDTRFRRVVIELSSGGWLWFSPKKVSGLENATVEELNQLEITPSDYGVHFPATNASLWYPDMLRSHFGSHKGMAA
jgi:hypothetical protein